MSKGKARHMFAGGNTSLGFFSYFDNIITQQQANRIFIIKGGPGAGKSYFMKRVGRKMQDMGYDVEYFHCSSDHDSLDGIAIPKLKIAFIDGTAPHVVDPKNPGAVDEILNFGEFWNDEAIRAHKHEIIDTNKKIAGVFKRAYRYLKAAAAIYEDSAEIYLQALNNAKLNQLADDLIKDLLAGAAPADKEGMQRSLFASALTPGGFCHYLDTLLTTSKVYELKGGMGTGEQRVLEKIKTAAIERGFDVEAYYCALNPYKLEHLVIPKLDAAFTTSNRYHTCAVKKLFSCGMRQYMDKDILELYKGDLYHNMTEFESLISTALSTISRAKDLHDKLEAYYIPNIRFEETDRLYEDVMSKILEAAGGSRNKN